MYCKTLSVYNKNSNWVTEAVDHCRYHCGSAILANGELAFQKALHDDADGKPLIWANPQIRCHHAIEWPLYKAIYESRARHLSFTVGVRPCAHCAVEVTVENGLEDWNKEKEKHPALDVAPLCSNEVCRSYGWVTKNKKKPNQQKVAQQKRAAKKQRLEEHRRGGIVRPVPVAHSDMAGRRPRSIT